LEETVKMESSGRSEAEGDMYLFTNATDFSSDLQTHTQVIVEHKSIEDRLHAILHLLTFIISSYNS